MPSLGGPASMTTSRETYSIDEFLSTPPVADTASALVNGFDAATQAAS